MIESQYVYLLTAFHFKIWHTDKERKKALTKTNIEYIRAHKDKDEITSLHNWGWTQRNRHTYR